MTVSSRDIAVLGLTTTATAATGGAVLAALSGPAPAGALSGVADVLLIAVIFTAAGLVVHRARPGPAAGVLLVQGLSGALTAAAAVLAPRWVPAARAVLFTWLPAYAPTPAVLLMAATGQPSGAASGPPARRWSLALLLCCAAGTVLLAAGSLLVPAPELRTEDRVTSAAALVLLVLGFACGCVCLVAMPFVLVSLVRQARRELLPVTRYLLPAAIAVLLGLALEAGGVPGGWVAGVVAVPVALLWAWVRGRLWDVDVVLNRGAAAAVTGVAVVVAYVALVGALSNLFDGDRVPTAQVVGAAAVGLTVAPLARWVDRRVRALLVGHRGDPWRAVQALASSGSHAPAASVLDELVAHLAESLAVPFVRITLADGSVASVGRPAAQCVELPLGSGGEPVGRLSVSPRSRSELLSRADLHLLRLLGPQVEVAARAVLLAKEVSRSRASIVTARESERVAIRRDLHDGVGPHLVGLRMLLAAARREGVEEERRTELLRGVDENLRTATAEVRAVVDRLRPPALAHGLVAALESETTRWRSAGLRVELRVGSSVVAGALGSAVETAAYRIVCEAVTNAARHSLSTCVDVALDVADGHLQVRVQDDGVGSPGLDRAPGRPPAAAPAGGVGTGSMRERAAELGGHVRFTATRPHGTLVTAVLPLPPAAPAPGTLHADASGAGRGPATP